MRGGEPCRARAALARCASGACTTPSVEWAQRPAWAATLCPWPRESPEVLARKLRSAALPLAPRGSCVRNLPNLPCAACVCVCVWPLPPTPHHAPTRNSGFRQRRCGWPPSRERRRDQARRQRHVGVRLLVAWPPPRPFASARPAADVDSRCRWPDATTVCSRRVLGRLGRRCRAQSPLACVRAWRRPATPWPWPWPAPRYCSAAASHRVWSAG